MFGLLRLFFRMPWWAYMLVAPLLLAGGVFAYISDQDSEAAKLLARHRPPPAAVAIENFDPAHNAGPAGEVVIVGQVDLARAMELTETKNGSERHHWTVAAIYPAGATDTSQPALGALVNDGALNDAQLASFITPGTGAFGPIMKIDGLQADDSIARDAVRKAIGGKIAMVSSPLLIDPFENGRKAGLAASDGGKVIAGIIVGLALLCLGLGFYRRSEKRSSEEAYI